MTRVTIACLLLCGVAGAAFGEDACSLITREDATAFFGSAQFENMGKGEMCAYQAKASKVILAAVNYTKSPAAKKLFDMNRQGMTTKGNAKDEVGLGAAAFSGSTPTSFNLFLLKGDATVQLSVSTEKGAVPPELMDKLRAVAKKAASRM